MKKPKPSESIVDRTLSFLWRKKIFLIYVLIFGTAYWFGSSSTVLGSLNQLTIYKTSYNPFLFPPGYEYERDVPKLPPIGIGDGEPSEKVSGLHFPEPVYWIYWAVLAWLINYFIDKIVSVVKT